MVRQRHPGTPDTTRRPADAIANRSRGPRATLFLACRPYGLREPRGRQAPWLGSGQLCRCGLVVSGCRFQRCRPPLSELRGQAWDEAIFSPAEVVASLSADGSVVAPDVGILTYQQALLDELAEALIAGGQAPTLVWPGPSTPPTGRPWRRRGATRPKVSWAWRWKPVPPVRLPRRRSRVTIHMDGA